MSSMAVSVLNDGVNLHYITAAIMKFGTKKVSHLVVIVTISTTDHVTDHRRREARRIFPSVFHDPLCSTKVRHRRCQDPGFGSSSWHSLRFCPENAYSS